MDSFGGDCTGSAILHAREIFVLKVWARFKGGVVTIGYKTSRIVYKRALTPSGVATTITT